jgi:charged multivesicular body protein 2A
MGINKSKPLKEMIRENKTMLRQGTRELDKEIGNLKRQDKQLTLEIRKQAKAGQISTVRLLAKDLVRNRNCVTHFIEMKSHLNAVGLKMQTIKSHEAMAHAMQGVTKALVMMNGQQNVPGLQKVMAEFLTAQERNEMMQEALGEAMDEATHLADGESTAQEDLIVSQILDELNAVVRDTVPEAPKKETTSFKNVATDAAHEAPHTVPESAGTGGAGGADLIDLEQRLHDLNKP